MSLTVESLMEVDGMNQCILVAGDEGLTRKVTFATIMEVPDIVKWLKGDELIITSLYPIKDDVLAQEQLIHKLHQSGAAALAVKPRRFVDEIPHVILSEAEKYQFPIIEIPEELSYLDILFPIMNTIFHHKHVDHHNVEKAHQMFNEISLGSKGIDNLIEILSNLTENIISVESRLPYLDVPKTDFPFKTLNDQQIEELTLVKRPIKLKREYEGTEVDCIVAPIFIGEELCGSLTSWGTHSAHTEVDLAVLEKANTFLTLEFLKAKVKYDVEQQYKNDFIIDLLMNEHIKYEEIKQRGTKFNFCTDTSYMCFIIELKKNDGNQLSKFNQLESAVHRCNQNLVTGYINDWFCILYPLDKACDDLLVKEKAKNIYHMLINNLFPKIDFRLGIGRYYSGIEGLRKSFHEAKKSLSFSDKNNDIVFYSDLGVYSLIGQIRNKGELKLFYEDTIGVLLEYDTNSELQLLNTLQCYFENDERLNVTAEKLFIHINTLKYRIKRIEILTNYDLKKADDKLMLHLALKVYNLMSNPLS